MREIPKKKNIPNRDDEANQQEEIDDFCDRLASILVSIVLEEKRDYREQK